MAWLIRYGAHVWQWPWQFKALYQKALAIFEEAGDELGKVEILYRLGWSETQLGNYQEADQLFQNCLALARKYHWQGIVLNCLVELGHVHWALGNYEQAEEFLQQSIPVAGEIGYHSQTAKTQRYLARLALSRSDHQTARNHLQESLAIYEELGLRGMKAQTLGEMSQLTVDERDFVAASQLAQDSLALCQEREHVMGEITPHTVLGQAALGWGDFEAAERYFRCALQVAGEVWQPSLALHTLVGLAQLRAVIGEKVRAYETATFVMHHPASWQWSRDTVAPLAAQLEVELPSDVMKAAQSRGKEKELDRVIEELTKVAV
jgi:tetratricopeptide (TPR) repeat protein